LGLPTPWGRREERSDEAEGGRFAGRIALTILYAQGMPPIQEPSRPIIVCGMPRTGTTLIGQLVKTAGWDNVVMFPEFAPDQVPAMFDLLEQTRAVLRSQAWRPFTDEDIEARVCELHRRIIGSGRDPEPGGDDIGQPRYGFKQPRAEIQHERFAAALGPFLPQYVYTFRNPVDAYRSFVGISQVPPTHKEWANWLDESSQAATDLATRGDLFPVNTELWASDAALRATLVYELFSFLGLEPTDETEGFTTQWPEINRREVADREQAKAEAFPRRQMSALNRYRDRTESLPLP
jgi:hypothetical protein